MLQPNTQIDGLYQIHDVFHGGGMGIVYSATHSIWNSMVAIKHPKSDTSLSAVQIEAFQKECMTWSSIGIHPYITTCYYYREIAGYPCVVSEFLKGGSLEDQKQSKSLYRGDSNECLSRLLSIAASTAWGLMHAHNASLLHCDLKPANILLNDYGIAKIADFGIALSLSNNNGIIKQNLMTRLYAAPEQIRLEQLSPAVDAWGWAATMLSIFMGEVAWENGAACGAVLCQFLEEGGKAYRIPAMPKLFSELLEECFSFSPDARISDFEEIAERVCAIHEEILGSLCPAQRPDLELVSADSLNNRAVSRLDLNDTEETYRLLDEALIVDPLHPESNYNAAILAHRASGMVSNSFLDRLEQDAILEPGEYRPWLYRACLLNISGKINEAAECLKNAHAISNHDEAMEIKRIWNLSSQNKLPPVLSPPISGEDFAHDSARFHRLMEKAESAIRDRRIADANRYLLMSGDITSFRRHPRRRLLMSRI